MEVLNTRIPVMCQEILFFQLEGSRLTQVVAMYNPHELGFISRIIVFFPWVCSSAALFACVRRE